MGRLLKIEEGLTDILVHNEETRSNDKLLYKAFLEYKGFDTNVSLTDFLESTEYPNLESVRRCRQKIQAKRPDLRPPEEEQMIRRAMQGEYRDYALS